MNFYLPDSVYFNPPKWVRSPQNWLFPCYSAASSTPLHLLCHIPPPQTHSHHFFFFFITFFSFSGGEIIVSVPPGVLTAVAVTPDCDLLSSAPRGHNGKAAPTIYFLIRPLDHSYYSCSTVSRWAFLFHHLRFMVFFFWNFQHWTVKLYLQWMDLDKQDSDHWGK